MVTALTCGTMEQDKQLKPLIDRIITDNSLHARWLNTLSMMENTGARKISKYEDPTTVTITILKHAAEEARHAYFLKKQIEKLPGNHCADYSFPYLLTPQHSHRYLDALDVESCRYAKKTLQLLGRPMKHAAYLLVTYAIEVRADMLYGIYQDELTRHKSKVSVKSIIAEEEGHLREMQRMMETSLPDWQHHAEKICTVESRLFEAWLKALDGYLPVM